MACCSCRMYTFLVATLKGTMGYASLRLPPEGYAKLCECGCGLRAPIAPYSTKNRGLVKGQPYRFIAGHNGRKAVQYEVNPENGCWEWVLGLDGQGYGSTTVDGKTRNAYAVYYKKYRGQVPEGLELDHLCKNHACVNPWHLEPVTHAVNMRRAIAKLTYEQVDEVKKTDFTKTTKVQLANKFGVSPSTISKIAKGHNWVNT